MVPDPPNARTKSNRELSAGCSISRTTQMFYIIDLLVHKCPKPCKAVMETDGRPTGHQNNAANDGISFPDESFSLCQRLDKIFPEVAEYYL